MTLPPVVRVFFAIDLPDSVKEKLGAFIVSLKKKARTHGIRWTKPANLHITLQFLAETQTQDLQSLIKNVRERIQGAVNRCEFKLGSLHVFPNPYRPRVIVLDVFPQDNLAVLSGLIGEGIKASHYEIESRPFRAHLTLGRIKQPQDVNLSFLSQMDVPEFERMLVTEVILFRSEPQPEGSEYTVMETLQLVNNNFGNN
jgi:RNA 2',3'-cyclic 3'-phosphodiesterase